MTREIVYSSQFKKDMKQAMRRGHTIDERVAVVTDRTCSRNRLHIRPLAAMQEGFLYVRPASMFFLSTFNNYAYICRLKHII